jgi:hypothetical protein
MGDQSVVVDIINKAVLTVTDKEPVKLASEIVRRLVLHKELTG